MSRLKDYLEESGRSERGPDLSPGDSSQEWGDRARREDEQVGDNFVAQTDRW